MKAFVFSGGGAYAASELGIIKYILEKDLFNPAIDLAIGTSFGAISAGSLALEHTDDTMLDMLIDFNQQVPHLLSGWSLAWSMISFPYTLGLQTLEMILGPYFGGTPTLTNRALITIATDLIEFKPVYFTNAMRQLEQISILESISASASIPLIFEPLKVSKYICVDGGITDNFPVNLISDEDTAYAFGSPLGHAYYAQPTKDLLTYLSTLLNGAIYRLNKEENRNISKKVKYCPYTSHATNMLDFSHYEEDFDGGYETAKQFFEGDKQ